MYSKILESLSDYNGAIWFEPTPLIYSDVIRDQINEAIGRKSDRLVASFTVKLSRDVPYVIEVDLFFPERMLPKWAFGEYPSGVASRRVAEIQFPTPILKTIGTFIEL